MKRTREDVAERAQVLADALAGTPLLGQTMRELALMIVDLANLEPPDSAEIGLVKFRTRKTVPMRKRKR